MLLQQEDQSQKSQQKDLMGNDVGIPPCTVYAKQQFLKIAKNSGIEVKQKSAE